MYACLLSALAMAWPVAGEASWQVAESSWAWQALDNEAAVYALHYQPSEESIRIKSCKWACKWSWWNLGIQTSKWVRPGRETTASGKQAGQGLAWPAAQPSTLGEGRLAGRPQGRYLDSFRRFSLKGYTVPVATFLPMGTGLCYLPTNINMYWLLFHFLTML